MIATDECPSRSETTLGWIPARRAIVACVSKVMEADPTKSGLLGQRLEASGHPRGIGRSAVLADEDKAVVLPRFPVSKTLFQLLLAMIPKRLSGAGVESDQAATRRRLRLSEHDQPRVATSG